tara:strand:+ start:59 stop:556 length:498 start_codon:yes stop_codon:yes gene_type:complete
MNKRHLTLNQNVQRKRRSSSLRRSSRKNSRKFSRRTDSKKRYSRTRSSRKPSTSKSGAGFSKSQIKDFVLSPYVPYVIALGTLLGTSIQANRNANREREKRERKAREKEAAHIAAKKIQRAVRNKSVKKMDRAKKQTWICQKCGEENNKWRAQCNICGAPRPTNV